MAHHNNSKSISKQRSEGYSLSRTFMSGVFMWMFTALIVSSLTAYVFASSQQLLSALMNFETGQMTVLGWIVLLSPLGFVMLMSFRFSKLSAASLTLLFLLFSILMGMSLSFILLAYTASSIWTTFLITSGMFGTMAVLGYTTKTDLTRFGSLMMMGLIGLIIAMVVNFFMQSSMMDYIISIIGVLIFTGLTAYDVQRLKRIGSGTEYGHESTKKLIIMGALRLYLDFINLFLFLLRLLGNRK